jgi:hypothetical protein
VIAEYASVVAAMAVLVSTITGAFGQKLAALPTSQGSALTAVSAGARAQKLPAGAARAVYKRAPYKKPVLKYLYTVGWIGGKKSSLSCLFARSQRSETEQEALMEIRRNAKLVHQLRRVHVGLKAASTTLVSGIASACGG